MYYILLLMHFFAGGTIKDEGTNTNSIITAAADVGYNGGRPNRGGDIAATMVLRY